jgi:phospholipid/cholesterol/gamma-HCH transport system substrate-binding protein
LKIGLLAVTATVVAAVVIFTLSGQGGFFWQRYYLKTRFANIAGLKAGAPVRVAGVEVGAVTGIQFVGAEVEVVYQLSRDVQPRITDRSRAALGSISLLGQGTVDLTAATTGTPVPEWGYVPAGRMPGQLSDVAASASQGLDEAARLLRDVRAGQGTIGRLFTDDRLYADIQEFLAAAENVANQVSRGQGTLGRLVSDPAAYASLEASLRNLEAMTRRVSAGEGSLGRLLADDRLAQSMTSATASVDAIAGRINRGEGTAGKLVTDEALFNRLNSIASRLDALTAQITAGQGTAGQLLQDRQLYENMNGAASELRKLVGDIRKDPRKYLNVKVSIF